MTSHRLGLLFLALAVWTLPARAQDHYLVCPNSPGAVYAQDQGFGTTLGWGAFQPSPPTYMIGVGSAERQYSSQRVTASACGLVRYGFASMDVLASVDHGTLDGCMRSWNAFASAGAELQFFDRLFVQSSTLPSGSIVTVKIVAVTTRGNRTFVTRHLAGNPCGEGTFTNTPSPNGTYTVRYQAASTNGLILHSRQLTQSDGSTYRTWITNAMVGGSIYLSGSVYPSVSINLSASHNKNSERASDQCSVFITARALETNYTLTSASGTVYPPEYEPSVEVAAYGTNQFVVAAPPGMVLQTVGALGDGAAWSAASSNLIAPFSFTNNAGFFRAAAP